MMVGVDVQLSRDCPYIVLDSAGVALEAGWLASAGDAAGELRALVRRLAKRGRVAVGIDAPRRPLPRPREHAFRGGRWRLMRPPGKGRHCEVVIRSLNLANPQWTPMEDEAPAWMRLGFSLFQAARGAHRGLEVFPSATYRALAEAPTRVPGGLPQPPFRSAHPPTSDDKMAAASHHTTGTLPTCL